MILEISQERAHEIIEKVATFVATRRMASAAIMTIESLRPLHNIGSQVLYFLAPFAELIFNPTEYQEFAALLENDENIKYLLKRIDELDVEIHKEERNKNRLQWKRKKNKIVRIFKSNKRAKEK
ncbi:MAG: hypothetical protein APR54_00200 [Candidatus Cloacimonas sp. SDB]|nr:MAG: hypothetical protein APR54_00200 [Candidatus Cloacimonas sp. SDB]